jgi:putative transposase
MVIEVSDKELTKLAEQMMAQLTTEGDVDAFAKALRKQFWEASLEGEIDDHLGYSKHERAGSGSGNSRNGKIQKRLKSEHGDLEINAPWYRNGTFEPKAVGKRQSRVSGIDDKILFLYAKGQSTRDIASTIEEL